MSKIFAVFLSFALLFWGAGGVFASSPKTTTYNPLALVRGKAKKSRSRTGARVRKKRQPRTGARSAPVYPNSELNQIEKAQLLAGHSDDEIKLALALRFLELWTTDELQAELAARAARKKQTGQ